MVNGQNMLCQQPAMISAIYMPFSHKPSPKTRPTDNYSAIVTELTDGAGTVCTSVEGTSST